MRALLPNSIISPHFSCQRDRTVAAGIRLPAVRDPSGELMCRSARLGARFDIRGKSIPLRIQR